MRFTLLLLVPIILFSVLHEEFLSPTIFTEFKIIINKRISQQDFKPVSNNSQTIFIPAGEYLLNNSIEIPSNTTIIGAGPATIIKVPGNNFFKITKANNITIKDLVIQGNENWRPEFFSINEHGWIIDDKKKNLKKAQYKVSLLIDKSTYINIENVAFRNLETAIEIAPIQGAYSYLQKEKALPLKFSLLTREEIPKQSGDGLEFFKFARIYDHPALKISGSRFENVRIALLTRGRNFYLTDNFIFNSIEGITGFNLSFTNLNGSSFHKGAPFPSFTSTEELDNYTAEGAYLRQERMFYNKLFYQKRSNIFSANNTITYAYYSDIDYLFLRDYRDVFFSDKISSSIIRNPLKGIAGLLGNFYSGGGGDHIYNGATNGPLPIYDYLGFSFYNSYIENENGFEILSFSPINEDSLIFDGVFFNEKAFIYQGQNNGLIQRSIFNKNGTNLDLYRIK